MLPKLARVLVSVCCLGVVIPAEATLMSRLGGDAAYDDMLDILWATDADLNGLGTWQDQLDWIDSLNSSNYLGFNDWRLASMSVSTPTGSFNTSVVDCSSVTEAECKDNELSYMFYYNFSGSFGDNLTGDQTVGEVTFTDIQYIYWSGTEFGSIFAWPFYFSPGGQLFDNKGNGHYG